jgi:hypothetical protein
MIHNHSSNKRTVIHLGMLSVLLLLVTSAAFWSHPLRLLRGRGSASALSTEGLQAQPEPANSTHVLCNDFGTDGVMIVLEGTPLYVIWTVYQGDSAGGWRRIQRFQSSYGESVKILENGDVLQEGAGDHRVTWRWSDGRFSAVKVDPPLIAKTCSLAEANELAFRTGAAENTFFSAVEARFLICADFSRYGVMLFAESPFKKDAKLDSINWVVYRKVDSIWNREVASQF